MILTHQRSGDFHVFLDKLRKMLQKNMFFFFTFNVLTVFIALLKEVLRMDNATKLHKSILDIKSWECVTIDMFVVFVVN